MNNDDLEHLTELKNDDYIWYIYIFIVFAALLSNALERDYIYTKSQKELESYHIINIIVLTIAFFIYLYFLKVNAHHYEKKRNFSNCLSLIATIFLVLSGALALTSEIKNSSETSINLGF